MRYGSNLRNFILSVSVASLPIVQWKPPPRRVVEAVVLRSGDNLRFPGTFAALPPRCFLSTADYDIVAIVDEEEVFGQDTSTWDWHTCCLYNVPEIVL